MVWTPRPYEWCYIGHNRESKPCFRVSSKLTQRMRTAVWVHGSPDSTVRLDSGPGLEFVRRIGVG